MTPASEGAALVGGAAASPAPEGEDRAAQPQNTAETPITAANILIVFMTT